MSKYNVGNVFGFSCTECEYNRHCYGGDLGNQYKFCQKSREKLENLDELEKENQKLKRQLEVGEEQYNDLVEEKEKLEQENQELKKQLEEKESQQKEFLEYLKNKERQFDIMGDPINSGACLGISREYKKIIGVKDE